MLREYRLTNFKAFGETVTIPIRPLTLIFGANSSGKSSIFQSLLLLKQTLKEAKNPATALLPKGSLVDLGIYRDFVHRHETSRNFEFEVRFDLELKNISPLMQKILGYAGSEKAGISIQFFSEKEGAAVSFDQADIAIGDEKQALISCLREDETYEIQIKFDNPANNSELEFWRHWYNGTKDYIELYDPHADMRAFTESLPVLETPAPNALSAKEKEEKQLEDTPKDLWAKEWRAYSEKRRQLEDAIEDLRAKEKEAYLEKLSKYQYEDAIEDLRANMKSSAFFVTYRNFLPKSTMKVDHVTEGPFDSRDSFRGFFDSGVRLDGPEPPPDRSQERYNGMYNEIDGYDISRFVEPVCSTFRCLLEGLAYLGPLRSQPQRHYERHYEFSSDTTSYYVGQTGEYLSSILFQRPELVEQVNEDLERLKVKYQLKVSKLQYEEGPSPSNVFSLRLVDTDTGIDASLRDVGFGISQVLPIVMQNRLSEKKTLLIEQPEIHLHPAHQAELGDMFIRSALGEQHNTLLLETHSEHLLLRIMRRMRETSTGKLPEGAIPVRPEDVAVLFVESDGSQSIVREMPLNERGDLVKAWPGGFFEEGLREIL